MVCYPNQLNHLHAGLAVARGIWRRIRTGRSVPVKVQLRSHRLFSANFEAIAKQVGTFSRFSAP